MIIRKAVSRLTRWSLVAGRIADIAFPALHAHYIAGTYLYVHGPHRFCFEYTINSSWGQKQRRDIELYQRRKNKFLCPRCCLSKYWTGLDANQSPVSKYPVVISCNYSSRKKERFLYYPISLRNAIRMEFCLLRHQAKSVRGHHLSISFGSIQVDMVSIGAVY